MSVCLAASAPAFLAWGPQRVLIYNDRYRSLCGDEHPHALGRAFGECALAASPAVGDALERAVRGEAVCLADHRLLLSGAGGFEERVFALSFSPMRDETGAVAGMLQTLIERARQAGGDARTRAHSQEGQGERGRTERALREANRRLSAVLESVSDVFIAVDSDWRIAGINERALALADRRREDVLGRDVWDTFPMYLGTALEAALRRAMRSAEPARHEFRGVVSGRWFEISIYPSDDGLSLFGRDIDERKRAEHALRDSEERFRQVADVMPQIVWTAAPDGRITFINRQWELYTGLTLEETNQRDAIACVLHPEDMPRAFRSWAQSLASGEPHEVQWRFRRRADGVYRWFLTRAVPIRGDDGRIREWFGTATDIHEQKLVEERLRRSEQRFAQFMHHLPGSAWVKDAAGRLVYVNEAAAKTWGMPRKSLLGKTVAAVFPPAPAAQCRESDELAARDPAGVQVLETFLDGEGALRHALVSKFPIPDADGARALLGGIAIDITERKRAEEALRESEERLRLALRAANAGVWRSEVASGETFWSEEFEPLYGFDAATPRTYETWLARVHPEDRERVKADFFARLKSAETEFQYEFRIVHPRRGARWILDLGRVERCPQGRAISFSGINLDITERKQAEEALRRERELLQKIFDTIPVMITMYEPDTRVLRLNRAFERLAGWSAGDVAGSSLMEACYPDPAYRAEVQRFMDSCRDGWMDIRMRTRDGRDIETSWANIRLSDRTQIGIGIDISERRRAEEALRNSERLYRAIGESIDYGVWVCDPDGRNTYASDSFLRLVGQTQVECSAFGWGRVLHPDDAERTLAAWKECVRAGGAWDFEHRFRGGDGNWHPILARGVPVRNEHGEITAWAGINLDISRLKQVEEELRAADRRKDEFLATLAHELRNPLAPLRNGLEILRLARDNREALEQARAMMERQLSHMVRLIDDLLDLSRITRGRVELRRERVDLAVVMRHAIETSRPLIEQAGHELSIRVPRGPVFVDADAIRLAQVFANLLNNAAKYTKAGGHVRVSIERRGATAEVSVKDDGIDIPPPMLAHVFEMFSRVEQSPGKAHGGLGIGLSIVRRLLEMHGGTVEARSAGEGMGSEFLVRLPVMAQGDAAGERRAGHAEADAAGVRCRILVADDNADAAASLATVLAILGSDVRIARDGLEAVQVAARFRPELVLLDIGMPGLDGYDACRRIRQLPGGREAVIVALTGWGHEEDKRRSQAAGFDRHLVKPVEPAVLERLLGALSGRACGAP